MSLIDEQGSPTAALEAGLSQVRGLLAELGGIDLHTVPGETVMASLDDLEDVHRQVEAFTARALATIEADGRWALDGARSMSAWYRTRSGRHHSTSTRQVRQARALRDHLPGTAAALASAEISADHAAAMVRYTTDTPVRRDKLADPAIGEDFLLDQARTLDATAFTIVLRHWGLRADPEAGDRAYVADSDREEFYLSETTDGYVPGGWLSKASGEVVKTALEARVGTPAATDTRTSGQRGAGALVSLGRLALDSGTLRPGARIRPHLAVHVPFDTLQRLIAASTPTRRHPGCPLGDHRGAAFGVSPTSAGPGLSGGRHGTAGDRHDGEAARPEKEPGTCECGQDLPGAVIGTDLNTAAMTDAAPATFDDGTPLSPALLARLTCDSQLHRVVFGPKSEVLDAGREKRIFTPAQTRAIIARDRHCRFPDCHAPPGEGEIHHSIWWWAQFGATDIKLGILLCWHHHDFVHKRRIAIEHRGDHWTFLRRDGTPLGRTAVST